MRNGVRTREQGKYIYNTLYTDEKMPIRFFRAPRRRKSLHEGSRIIRSLVGERRELSRFVLFLTLQFREGARTVKLSTCGLSTLSRN